MLKCFATFQAPILGSQEEKTSFPKSNRFVHLWNFLRPDLAVTLTGIIFYGLIGGTYPIIGTIMADINFVRYISFLRLSYCITAML